MTDVDRVRDAEQRLREDLRRTLVPPPTPATLSAAVERLAERPLAPERAGTSSLGSRGGRRLLEAAVGIAAVIGVAIGLWAILQVRGQDQVATSPHPTLPAVAASPLPSAAAHPTLLESGAWIDSNTAWTIDQPRTTASGDEGGRLRVSADGGQTWSEPRPVVSGQSDLEFDMFDAEHGVTGTAVQSPGTFQLVLYRTSDGGRTWGVPIVVGSLADPTNQADGYDFAQTMHFVDRDHGVFLATSRQPSVEGQGGTIECRAFATDDGGTTWAPLAGAPCLTASPPTWSSASIGVMRGDAPGTLLVTQDGGRSWTTGRAPVADPSTVFATLLVTRAGDGTLRMLGAGMPSGVGDLPPLAVFESRDGGASWSQAYLPVGLPRVNPGLAQPLDADHWLAVWGIESLGGMDLLESWDAGRTWTAVAHAEVLPGWMRWLDRLHATLQGIPVDCVGTTCGGTGTILLTNDGGRTWHEPPY